jgi:hypothetical protein
VDRDARCAEEIAYLANNQIHVLPVAEVEHLYCLPAVLSAVLEHAGVKSTDIGLRLESFRQRLSRHHEGGAHRLALARAQDRVRWSLKFPLTSVSPGANSAEASANLETAFAAAITAVNSRTAKARPAERGRFIRRIAGARRAAAGAAPADESVRARAWEDRAAGLSFRRGVYRLDKDDVAHRGEEGWAARPATSRSAAFGGAESRACRSAGARGHGPVRLGDAGHVRSVQRHCGGRFAGGSGTVGRVLRAAEDEESGRGLGVIYPARSGSCGLLSLTKI